MSNSSAASHRRASVLGLGLIGGSICVALRDRGWIVSGDDHNPDRVAEALERGMIQHAGINADAEVTFVAVPVTALTDQVQRALRETKGIVTDVGSVKASVAREINDARFVGGHPMAGSELEGLDGEEGPWEQALLEEVEAALRDELDAHEEPEAGEVPAAGFRFRYFQNSQAAP